MKFSNLPPGVTESMIPGNRPENQSWDDFIEWVYDEFVDSELSVDEAYLAIKMGIASIKSVQNDIDPIIKGGS